MSPATECGMAAGGERARRDDGRRRILPRHHRRPRDPLRQCVPARRPRDDHAARRAGPRRRASTRTRSRARCGSPTRCSKPSGRGSADVTILGGWFGVLAAVLLHDPRFSIGSVSSVDIDPRCAPIALSVNATHVRAGRFAAAPPTCSTSTTAGARGRGGDRADLVINTSCEHLAEFGRWYERVPPGQRLVLQSNDYFACDQHVNCVARPRGLSRPGADARGAVRRPAPDAALRALHADRAEMTRRRTSNSARTSTHVAPPCAARAREELGEELPRRGVEGRGDASGSRWAPTGRRCLRAAPPDARPGARSRLRRR